MKNLFINLFVLLLLIIGCAADKEGETEELQNVPGTAGSGSGIT
jgi:uncharacterized protein YcfL